MTEPPKALVTGSSGFLGRRFVAELRGRGFSVVACDLDEYLGWDALKLFRVESLRYDLVVHAAADSPHRMAIDTKPATLARNQLLDAAMFDWAARTCQGRILYISSCAALDEYPDAYGLLKLTGERLAAQVRDTGVPVTVVRPFSGYGEDQSDDFPFGAFVTRAERIRRAYATCTDTDQVDSFEVWGDGSQIRDWIYVDDVVRGALAVVASDTEDPVSLCTGVGTSIFDLACMICDQAGIPRRFRFCGERPAGTPRRVGDPTALYRYYTPKVSLEEGVRRALTRQNALRRP